MPRYTLLSQLNTPDEKDSHYLTLSVEVTPWRGALITENPNS